MKTLGDWALLSGPSILAILPLFVYVVMVFRNKSSLSGLIPAILVGAILTGQGFEGLGKGLVSSLSSFLAIIGIIVMFGAGLGSLMTKTRVSHALVYWIVKGIGVNSEKRAIAGTLVSSTVICGLLGTLAGGNAVIAPVLIPLVASVGLTPSALAILFKVGGEVGLIIGPLTGVTITTLALTGLSYGDFMLWAAIPFCTVWIGATVFAVFRIQKKLRGIEQYEVTVGMDDLQNLTIDSVQRNTTIAFAVAFVGLVGFGLVTNQGINYAIVVMLLLSAVLAVAGRMEIDRACATFAEGAASMVNLFLIFVLFDVVLRMVSLGGGFEALGKMLEGVIHSAGSGQSVVMIVGSFVGGFGIEAAAVAELKILHEMFAPLVNAVSLPMELWATVLLAATRITGATYPAVNFASQLGIARCTNTKVVLQACWIGAGALTLWVAIWAFVGPLLV